MSGNRCPIATRAIIFADPNLIFICDELSTCVDTQLRRDDCAKPSLNMRFAVNMNVNTNMLRHEAKLYTKGRKILGCGYVKEAW